MRPKCLLLLISLLSGTCSFAQTSRSGSSFWNKLVYGGNVGAQFGDITLIQVSPNIGYKLTKEWIAGVGFRYIYYNDRLVDYKTNIYGGSVYSQYYFLQYLIAHSEVEVLNLDAYNSVEQSVKRKNITSVLVGGGVKFYAGGSVYFTTLALWNLNETPDSPYSNPIIRIGIAVGI